MTQPLDETVVERVNELGATSWSGTVFRHAAGAYDPLSGRGAYMHGGRWNPKESFDALYLATPLTSCLAELRRMANGQGLEVVDLLRGRRLRELHTIEVRDAQVLDLRESTALARVGLEPSDIADDDWSGCQAIGQAAHFLGLGGILAPSATGVGNVFAAFESRLQPGQLSLSKSEPLTPDLYVREMGGPMHP